MIWNPFLVRLVLSRCVVGTYQQMASEQLWNPTLYLRSVMLWKIPVSTTYRSFEQVRYFLFSLLTRLLSSTLVCHYLLQIEYLWMFPRFLMVVQNSSLSRDQYLVSGHLNLNLIYLAFGCLPWNTKHTCLSVAFWNVPLICLLYDFSTVETI